MLELIEGVLDVAEKKKPNWIKIRNEYETSNISYQKLSKKHDVSVNTLRPRAVREGWAKSKVETSAEIALKTHQKSIAHASDEASAQDILHNYAFQMVIDGIIKTLATKPKVKNPITGDIDEYDYDPKDYDAITKSLERVQRCQRIAKGRMSSFEIEKLSLEKKKVESDILRASGGADDGEENGIVIMPPVDAVVEDGDENA